MKKTVKLSLTIGILLAILASSCAVKTPYTQEVAYIDYSAISAETGVFITEAPSISTPYEGMGSVTSFVTSGYEVKEYKQEKDDGLYDSTSGRVKYGKYLNASSVDAVHVAAEKAKEMGANGIINLQLKYFTGKVIASGMAVKIKQE